MRQAEGTKLYLKSKYMNYTLLNLTVGCKTTRHN